MHVRAPVSDISNSKFSVIKATNTANFLGKPTQTNTKRMSVSFTLVSFFSCLPTASDENQSSDSNLCKQPDSLFLAVPVDSWFSNLVGGMQLVTVINQERNDQTNFDNLTCAVEKCYVRFPPL